MADAAQLDSPEAGREGEVAIDLASTLDGLRVTDSIAEEDMEPPPEELQNDLGDTPSDQELEPAPPATGVVGKGGKGGSSTSLAPSASKFKWHHLSEHQWTPRAAWQGPEDAQVAPAYGHLSWKSKAHEFFQVVDSPDREYMERAANSELYRSYRHYHELDGRNKNDEPVKSYDGAATIHYADMRYLDATVLLNGLDPAVSRDKMFDSERLAVKGHRVSDLFDRKRYYMVRKFNHPTDPKKAIPRGQPGYDNLFQVSNMLDSLKEKSGCAVLGGKRRSVDEETLGFQGAHAELKQNSGRYKAAGDGLQCDLAACCEGGFLQGFAFRGHSLSPRVSIKESPRTKLSPLHQRVIYCLYLAKCEPGCEIGMDNLYNSVDFAHVLEKGATFVIEIPKSPTRHAQVIEWPVKGVHTVGTLRGNRGSEKEYCFKEKLSVQQEATLRVQPLIPNRVRVRVTDDEAQVMTVSIFDRKGFQMIDTVNTTVTVETKMRKAFDSITRRVKKKEVEITNTQNLYNSIMGYVDLNDLLAWQYRVNCFREAKFWWCVYLWVVRKRVDQAYCMYMIEVRKQARILEQKLAEGDRLAATAKAALIEEKKQFTASLRSHFDFIEDICAYHLVMGFNAVMKPEPLLGFSDWKSALAAGRRSNARTSSGKQRSVDSTSGRKRGKPWSEDPDSWPAERLSGVHKLGWHSSGDHHCDFPMCHVKHASYVKTPRPIISGRGSRGGRMSRTPSPMGLVALGSGDSCDRRTGRTKLYCLTCMDSGERRNMSFHVDCWNRWHGLDGAEASQSEHGTDPEVALLTQHSSGCDT